jgi:hypothetical protein
VLPECEVLLHFLGGGGGCAGGVEGLRYVELVEVCFDGVRFFGVVGYGA